MTADRPLPSPGRVSVGRVLSAHGRDGAVNVRLYSDVPERFEAGRILLVEGRPLCIVSSQERGPGVRTIFFREITRRRQAEELMGSWLTISEEDAASAVEGEYFHYQLLGMSVYTESGEALGKIVEILETGSNDVYVVAGNSQEVLVPATSQVVLQVDVPARRMTVRLLEGMV